MELAQLLVTPVTLLTAFIFIWNQTKTGNNELRQELNMAKEDLKEEFRSVRREVVAVRDEMKAEIREEIAPPRTEITAIRSEMHDMNGRLGRVEGLLWTPDAG